MLTFLVVFLMARLTSSSSLSSLLIFRCLLPPSSSLPSGMQPISKKILRRSKTIEILFQNPTVRWIRIRLNFGTAIFRPSWSNCNFEFF